MHGIHRMGRRVCCWGAGFLLVVDQNGNRIDKDDYDPAAYVGARLIAWL